MEVSFQRAIKIDSNTNPYTNYRDGRIDPDTMAVINTIKGYSSAYDRETSRKIGNFLRHQIGDYSRETGVFARRIEGHPYIFTGEEATKARKINQDAKKEMKDLETRYLIGPNSSMPLVEQIELSSERTHKILRNNIQLNRDRKMLEMVEEDFYDTHKKPDTHLKFTMDKNGKLTEITYRQRKTVNGKRIEEKANLTI